MKFFKKFLLYIITGCVGSVVDIATENRICKPSLNYGLVSCIHFCTIVLEKGMDWSSPPSYGLNSRINLVVEEKLTILNCREGNKKTLFFSKRLRGNSQIIKERKPENHDHPRVLKRLALNNKKVINEFLISMT